MTTPEARVKNAIKKEMLRRGWYWHMPIGASYGKPTLDFLCCMPVIIRPEQVGQRIGFFVGLEAKSENSNGQPTPRQQITINEIQAAGGFALTAQSWEQVAQILRVET